MSEAPPAPDPDAVAQGGLICPDCGRQYSRGPSGVEYGHAKYDRHNYGPTTGRCPRRPDVVDSSHPSAPWCPANHTDWGDDSHV